MFGDFIVSFTVAGLIFLLAYAIFSLCEWIYHKLKPKEIKYYYLPQEVNYLKLKDLIPLLNDNTEVECKDQSKSRYYIFNKERYSCYSNLYKDVLDDKKVIRITAVSENNLFILVE